MINLPTDTEIGELKAYQEPFCLTVYLPYIEPNTPNNPNRIELKNLLREAEKALQAISVKPDDIKKTVKPARDLLASPELWPVRHESLALYMHPDFFRYFHIPDHSTPYQLSVGKGFDLEPLLKIIEADRSYFVLALGHKNVRLYEGSHYELKPVHLKNFPGDMKKSLGIDEYPKWRETHAIAPASAGKGSEAYHSQYNVSQTDKDMLLQFFKRIDDRLRGILRHKHAPLILAGVDYLVPIYRQANTYQMLLPSSIKGNIEHTDPKTIRKRAWSLLNRRRS